MSFKLECAPICPRGILAVNVVGCFVFGVLFALFAKNGSLNSALCLFLTTAHAGGEKPSQPSPRKHATAP